MTQKSRDALRSPRRITIAILIALAMGSGTVGMVGLASADDDTFSLPARMVGDRYRYEITSSDHAMVHNGSVAEPRLWLDAEGNWHAADVMVRSESYTGLGGKPKVFELLSLFDQETWEPLAANLGGGSGYSGSSSALGGSETESSVHLRMEIGGTTLPCGMINSLQGAGEGLRFAGSCPDGAPERGKDAEWDGSPVRVYTVEDEDTEIELWFSSGIPYPVKRMVRHTDSEEWVWTLVGFEAGGQPIPVLEVPTEKRTLPIVSTSDLTRYGPDFSGVSLEYPLQQAIEEARDDPAFEGMRDFMESNPDWYVGAADYSEDPDFQWWIVTMATEGYEEDFWLQRSRTVIGSLAEGIPMVEESQASWARDYTAWGGRDADRPSFDELQGPVARFADTVALWNSYSGDGGRPVAIGFSLPRCMDPCHDEVRVHAGDVEAGVSSSVSLSLAPFDEPVEETSKGVSVVVDRNGTLTEVWLITRTYEHSGGPLAPPASDASSGEGATKEAGIPWSPPSGGAATGLTLASVLVSLLYWAWPAIKQLPLFGLLVRRRRPEALAHPVRRRIYEVVRDEPGLHYQAVLQRSGVGKGTVEHHLRRLLEAGLVSKVAQDGYTCYFPVGTDRRAMAAAPVLRSEGAQAVVAAIQASPGASVSDVAAATGFSPGTVSHHLRRLRERGVIESDRDGRTVRLTVAEWVAA